MPGWGVMRTRGWLGWRPGRDVRPRVRTRCRGRSRPRSWRCVGRIRVGVRGGSCTPTLSEGSGTEHEFRAANRGWEEARRPSHLLIYFCNAPIPANVAGEFADQLKSVYEFHSELRRQGLVRASVVARWFPRPATRNRARSTTDVANSGLRCKRSQTLATERFVMSSLAFDGTDSTPVGYFTFIVRNDHWAWSEGLYALHGYEPDEVDATTELMLQHKHPEDSARAFGVLEKAIEDAAPFSCYHRIIDAQERVRYVLSVGRGLVGPHGKVEQVTGFFVDLTEVRRSETQHEVDVALVEIAKTRSVIDQAKGIVMVGAGCDADAAFAILRRCSSHQNVKVNELARRVVERASHPAPHRDDLRLRDAMTLLSHPELFDLEPVSRPTG